MEFKHKLSRRLALSRTIATALLCVLATTGCEQGVDGLTQPESPVEFAWRGKKNDGGPVSVPKPQLVSMSITPDTALLAPGTSQGFTARGLLRDGSSVNLRVKWSVSGGTIDSTGLYAAPASQGHYRVFAEASGVTDSADVSIEPMPDGATVDQVVLTPATVSLEIGASQGFTASAKMSDGSVAPASVTYTATGGTISPAGSYVAGQTPGVFRVVATDVGGKADTSAVTVTAPAPTVSAIVLTPATSTLAAGTTLQFSALSKLTDGSTSSASVTYTATGGTITPAGLYTAGASAGTFRVIAVGVSIPLADTASITITVTTTPPPPSGTGEQAASADNLAHSVGVNIHLSYGNVYANFPLVKSMLADLGVKHVRDGGQAFADAGWMTRVHGRMKDLNQSLGIRANYIADGFGNLPAYEAGTISSYFSDTRGMDSVVKYAGAATVESFEGINEWNTKRDARSTTWAEEVRVRQKAIWNHVTAKYPAYRVIGPSFTRYVDACTVGDLSAYAHVGNMHPYPAGRPQSASLQENISNLRCVNGTDPLTSTETGYQTALQSTSGNRAVSERAAGKYVPRLYLSAFNTGVLRSYSYELVDQGVSTTDAEKSFGLYRNDGSAKPSAAALKQLLALLSDPGAGFTPGRLNYALQGDLTNVSHTLLQKRDGRFYLALWLEVSSFNTTSMTDITNSPRPLTLTLANAATWRVFRPNVGAGAVASGSGTTVSLMVPDEVVVVEVTP
jgi:hypothetical protein